MTSSQPSQRVCEYPDCGKPIPSGGLDYCAGHVLWPQDPKTAKPSAPPKIRKK